jgi:hypothetical protein
MSSIASSVQVGRQSAIFHQNGAAGKACGAGLTVVWIKWIGTAFSVA